MAWQHQLLIVIPFVLAALSGFTALFLWQARIERDARFPGNSIGILILIGAVEWLLAYGLEVSSIGLPTKVFWVKAQFLGMGIVSFAWLIYVLQYTGWERWLKPRTVIFLGLVPSLTLLLALTNETHGLVFRHLDLIPYGPISLLDRTLGPALWAYFFYCYLLIMVGAFLLFRSLLHSGSIYRLQAIALLSGILILSLVNIMVDMLKWNIIPGFQLTPIALGLTIPMIGWILYRIRLLDFLPVARRTLIEDMEDGVLVLNPQDQILDLNLAARKLIDMDRPQASGRPLAEVWPEWRAYRACQGDKSPTGQELILDRGEGKRIFDVYISPLIDWHGKAVSNTVVLRDITSRRTMEEHLRESEAKYRLLVENINDVIFTLDANRVFTYVSPSIERLTSFKTDEIIGQSIDRIVHPEDLPGLMESIRKTWAGGTEPTEFRILSKEGSLLHIRSSSRPLWRDDKPLGLVGLLTDISPYKRAEEALRLSDRRFRELADLLPQTVFECDERGTLTFANRSSFNMFGYSQEDFDRGLSALQMVVTDQRNLARENIQRVLRGEDLGGQEYLSLRKDGGLFPAIIHVSPIIQEGRRAGLRGIIIDISHLKEKEEALRQSEERARAQYKGIPIPTYTWQREGEDFRLVDYNDAALCLTEGKICEYLGVKANNLYRDRPDILAEMERCYVSRAPIKGELNYQLKSTGENKRFAFQCAFISPDLLLLHTEDITEHRRAEEALERSEVRYRSLIEQSGAGVAITDRDGKMTFANQSLCDMIGFSREELMGQPFFTHLHPEDMGRIMGLFKKAFSSFQGGLNLEFKVIHKDGHIVHCYSNPTISWFQGEILGFNAIIFDITERKRMEEALRESEERYRVISRNIPCAVYSALPDEHSTTIFLSGRMEDLTGYRPDEVLENPHFWNQILHPEDREYCWNRTRENREQKSPLEMEYRIITKEGLIKWISDHATPALNEKEEIIRIDGYMEDITERKVAEQALQLSEAGHRAVMEQSGDAIFLVDVQSKRVVEANPSFMKMLGYSSQEILELTLYDFISDGREEIDRRFQDLLEQKGAVNFERKYRSKDGSMIDVWVIATIIHYGDREFMCTTARDLSEKKAMERQMLRSQRMDSIGLLAGGIAHDLNNLLTPIMINAEILAPKVSDPTGRKMIASIASNAQRGADIVKQILTFSRGMEGESLPISSRYLLKEMEAFARETFPKSIAIETDIPNDLWPLSGDATQLHQVLMNLCLNAKDAMANGGALTLSGENLSLDEAYSRMHPDAQPGPYVLLSVRDTGAGIPEEYLSRIFDPFFTTKERGEGTGLGLSVTHGIVKGHRGFLNVHSQVGKGSLFHIYLPASPTAEVSQAAEESHALPSGQGELILLVEDEIGVRDIAQAILESHGYQVQTAGDGIEAISLYAQRRRDIQLVLTDMAMPNMDGPATIRALQKINPEVRVIVTSGLDKDRSITKGAFPSVQAFLQKPFTAQRLLEAVAKVLGETE